MALRRKAFAAFPSRFLLKWKSTVFRSEPSPALLEFRRVMLPPPQNGRVRYAYAPFAHHSDQVSITELKAQIPADAQNHDLPIEVPTLNWASRAGNCGGCRFSYPFRAISSESRKRRAAKCGFTYDRKTGCLNMMRRTWRPNA
jgi:hypothetical protein